ncbi:MAG TPA: hypothetical protein VFM27_17315 [Acidimicrobiales bacterium]|nr:hypothetical protein [Acidimicrobiales bacterium]
MHPVTRRSFLATGSAGALAVAGAATIGGPLASVAAADTADELTPAQAAALSGPTMLQVLDAATGEVEILVEERSIVFTDKHLVARVLRATR